MAFRLEKDSLGKIQVPVERLWGAQTQRSLHYFSISNETMDVHFIKALVLVKKCAAEVNFEMKLIPQKSPRLITGGSRS